MLTSADRIYRIMSGHSMSDVRTAYARRAMAESGHLAKVRGIYAANGWRRVVDAETARPDAVEIGGEMWEMLPEIAAKRASEALKEVSSNRSKKAHKQESTCTAIIDGQLCGGSLTRSTVCPRSTLGRHGVGATLTCEVCGAVTAEMRQA